MCPPLGVGVSATPTTPRGDPIHSSLIAIPRPRGLRCNCHWVGCGAPVPNHHTASQSPYHPSLAGGTRVFLPLGSRVSHALDPPRVSLSPHGPSLTGGLGCIGCWGVVSHPQPTSTRHPHPPMALPWLGGLRCICCTGWHVSPPPPPGCQHPPMVIPRPGDLGVIAAWGPLVIPVPYPHEAYLSTHGPSMAGETRVHPPLQGCVISVPYPPPGHLCPYMALPWPRGLRCNRKWGGRGGLCHTHTIPPRGISIPNGPGDCCVSDLEGCVIPAPYPHGASLYPHGPSMVGGTRV